MVGQATLFSFWPVWILGVLRIWDSPVVFAGASGKSRKLTLRFQCLFPLPVKTWMECVCGGEAGSRRSMILTPDLSKSCLISSSSTLPCSPPSTSHLPKNPSPNPCTPQCLLFISSDQMGILIGEEERKSCTGNATTTTLVTSQPQILPTACVLLWEERHLQRSSQRLLSLTIIHAKTL